MKLRAVSKERQQLFAAGAMWPIQLTRTEEGFKNLNAVSAFSRIDAQQIIKRSFIAAKWVRNKYKKIKFDAGEIEDAASYAQVKFFEITEFERPRSSTAIISKLIMFASAYFNNLGKTRRVEIAIEGGAAQKAYTPATQETRVFARQIYQLLCILPAYLQPLARKMAAGANVIEACEELDLDLFDGIKMVKQIRDIVSRLTD